MHVKTWGQDRLPSVCWHLRELLRYAVSHTLIRRIATFETPYHEGLYAVSLFWLFEGFLFFFPISPVIFLLSNAHQTTDSLSIPKVGNLSSQYGNILFPRREYDFEEDVRLSLNNARVLNDRGRLFYDKGGLFKDKRHLLKDLTLFFEEAPVYGRFKRIRYLQEVTWYLT